MSSNSHSYTYQTRLNNLTSVQDDILDAYATHYNHVERRLYADMQKHGKPAASFKTSYLIEFGLTARPFNAIGRNLEEKFDSVPELLPLGIQETELAIGKAQKTLEKADKTGKQFKGKDLDAYGREVKAKHLNKIHQKKRRLAGLEARLEQLVAQLADDDPRICFASRNLFKSSSTWRSTATGRQLH